jgi:hypothetical protein
MTLLYTVKPAEFINSMETGKTLRAEDSIVNEPLKGLG